METDNAAGVNARLGNVVKVNVCASTQPGLLKVIGAVRAPAGTKVVIEALLLMVNGADTSPNLTEVTPLKPLPVIVTGLPTAALLADLKQRGMLDDTLVVWGGEFGRTVYSQGDLTPESYGRDHHPRCFSLWMTGGGVKRGIQYGKTDDYSYNIVENPVNVHDLHATLLHLLGIDHKRLTYRYQGRDFRLTDVFGDVLEPLLA